jgi:hypothetical protein
MSAYSIPSSAPEPLEFWHPWHVCRSSRVSTCCTLYYVGVDPQYGIRWTAPRPRPCGNLTCEKCARAPVTDLLNHLYATITHLSRVWVAQVPAPGKTRDDLRRTVAQRARRLNAQLTDQGLPLCEWMILTAWDSQKTVVSTHDLSGRQPELDGSWWSGFGAFFLLRATVARIGVLGKWPSFRRGSPWALERPKPPKGKGLLEKLGDFDLQTGAHHFQTAADEAEKRWGVRPVDGQPVPSDIPIADWIEVLTRHHGGSDDDAENGYR